MLRSRQDSDLHQGRRWTDCIGHLMFSLQVSEQHKCTGLEAGRARTHIWSLHQQKPRQNSASGIMTKAKVLRSRGVELGSTLASYQRRSLRLLTNCSELDRQCGPCQQWYGLGRTAPQVCVHSPHIAWQLSCKHQQRLPKHVLLPRHSTAGRLSLQQGCRGQVLQLPEAAVATAVLVWRLVGVQVTSLDTLHRGCCLLAAPSCAGCCIATSHIIPAQKSPTHHMQCNTALCLFTLLGALPEEKSAPPPFQQVVVLTRHAGLAT